MPNSIVANVNVYFFLGIKLHNTTKLSRFGPKFNSDKNDFLTLCYTCCMLKNVMVYKGGVKIKSGETISS